jgi:signal transduction histidine kinase
MAVSMPCDTDELRSLFLFEKLRDDQLRWLCEHGHVEEHEAGVLYREGDPAEWFFVLLSGSVGIWRRSGADDVEISRTSQPGVYGGAFFAYLGERFSQNYIQTFRLLEPSRLYMLSAADFAEAMTSWFPMPLHLMEGYLLGSLRTQNQIAQRERLLALGSLSAGLTHELNNPAAATVRASGALRERVAGMRHKLALIAGGAWDRSALESLITLQERAVEQVAKAPTLTALEASDAEDELSDWFEAHDVRAGYELAPTFVQAGIDVAWLDRISLSVESQMLESAVRWLTYTVETELLMNEITDASNRISALVGAAKQYSQMDRAPSQVLDVHELLDSTLVMLSGKLGKDVTVVKSYDQTLPPVEVYGAELNQVWTNLIDNAIQAMDGIGTLTLTTTRLDDDHVCVEISDTGTGISPAALPRIFEPFFTTKPVGQGTGLGLDISWRIVVNKHHGDIAVTSEPGDTRFRVRLPIRMPAAG